MGANRCTARLLVDGYNIIGVWPSLKQISNRHGLELARRELVETLVNYSARKELETHLVFDAYAERTPGYQEPITKHLIVYYTDFGQTADSYIEKSCAQFRRQYLTINRRIIVATSDRAQQLTVIGYGAEWMSAQQLAADIQLIHRQTVQSQRRKRTRSVGGSFVQGLDDETREKLIRLRFGQ